MADSEPQEEFFLTNAARMLQWLPWLRLFRACNIAVGLRAMFLAAVGMVLLAVGGFIIGSVLNQSVDHARYWNPQLRSESVIQHPVSEFAAGIHFFLRCQTLVNLPLWTGINSETVARLLQLVWSLLVMSVVGGAIGRIAAVDVAGRGDSSLGAAVRYSLSRIWPSLMGMMIVVGAGSFLCGVIAVGGVISLIPLAGEFLLAVCWGFAFVMGIVVTLMGLGMIAGWPLMICTISVEDSDGFDAMGRAFSYLFHHVIYAVLLLAIAAIQGTFALILLTLFVETAQALTASLIGLGRGGHELGDTQFNIHAGWVWRQFVNWIPATFGLSYFWVAWTQIYFVLRARDDGTPFLMIQGVDPPLDPLPLSGMAAVKRREESVTESANES